MIDWSAMQTAEQKAAEQFQAAYSAAVSARQNAYREESDPIRFEAEYDAIQRGTDPDYAEWVEAVEAIKQRIPLPSPPTP